MDLTEKQKMFCLKYIELGANATKAYLEVYKTCKTEKTANASASRLIANVKVQEYLKTLQEELKANSIMTSKERMEYLSQIARGEVEEPSYDMFGKEYKKKPNFKTKMMAIDIMNKMDGEYVLNIKEVTPVQIVDDI